MEKYQKQLDRLNELRLGHKMETVTLEQCQGSLSEYLEERDSDTWPDYEDLLDWYLNNQIYCAEMWCGPEEDMYDD